LRIDTGGQFFCVLYRDIEKIKKIGHGRTVPLCQQCSYFLAGGEEILEVLEALNFNVWTFLLNTVNLLIVIGVLYILAYKPVTKILLERESQIEGAIEDAARSQREAKELLVKYDAQIKDAKEEAQQIIAKATKIGDEMGEEIVAKAREEANKALAKAKAEIEGEKLKALAEIKSEISSLVVLAAGRVIEKELSVHEHERLIQNFLTKAGELQ